MVAPVFLPSGEYTVIVGRVTLVTEVAGFPANSFLDVATCSGPAAG